MFQHRLKKSFIHSFNAQVTGFLAAHVSYYYPLFMKTLIYRVTLLKSMEIFLCIASPIYLPAIKTTKVVRRINWIRGGKLEAIHF